MLVVWRGEWRIKANGDLSLRLRKRTCGAIDEQTPLS